MVIGSGNAERGKAKCRAGTECTGEAQGHHHVGILDFAGLHGFNASR
jgi:hypothetical protein